MLIKTPSDIKSSEITDEKVYLSRRQFVRDLAALSTVPLVASIAPHGAAAARAESGNQAVMAKLSGIKKAVVTTDEALTPLDDIVRYNNFYEFGTDKGDPAEFAHQMQVDPWSFSVEGEVAKPGRYTLEDVLKPHALEERIYRLRCVEAWSMVVPWIGFSLGDLLRRFEPTSRAKYVAFETLYAPDQMPGTRSVFSQIEWPYVEGLRIDEAMHPLTILAVGLYGRVMPNQNGAPIRLVVPWKYGFKSIKSIVKIRLTEQQPPTSWNRLQPKEYGFYSNVNPNVDHPRWSQKMERRLPSKLFRSNQIPTRMFNGYEQQVAHLYQGMDLRKYF